MLWLKKINFWNVTGFIMIPVYYSIGLLSAYLPDEFVSQYPVILGTIYLTVPILILYLALRLRRSNTKFSFGFLQGFLAFIGLVIATMILIFFYGVIGMVIVSLLF